MNVSKLDKRVTIERYTEAQDGSGDPVKTWSVFAVVYASVEGLSGHEAFVARQTFAEVTHRVDLLYLAGLSPKMRIKYDRRYFDILGVVDPKEDKVAQVVSCVERVGGANG